MRSSLAICCLVAAASALASCGDSGPSAEDEVRAAAARVVETESAKTFCRDLVSAHYLDLVYGGDVAKCVSSDETVPEEPRHAKVTRVVVDPEAETRAEVAVKVGGGELDGTAGHLLMVEEKGRWRLDDYDDEYLRSAILAGIRTVDEGAAVFPPMKACFSRQVRTLDAGAVRELTFANDREDKAKVNAKLLKLAENCPNAMAEYGAWDLTKDLVASGKRSPAFAHCVRGEIQAFLMLTEITPELLEEHPGFAPSPRSRGSSKAPSGTACTAAERRRP